MQLCSQVRKSVLVVLAVDVIELRAHFCALFVPLLVFQIVLIQKGQLWPAIPFMQAIDGWASADSHRASHSDPYHPCAIPWHHHVRSCVAHGHPCASTLSETRGHPSHWSVSLACIHILLLGRTAERDLAYWGEATLAIFNECVLVYQLIWSTASNNICGLVAWPLKPVGISPRDSLTCLLSLQPWPLPSR